MRNAIEYFTKPTVGAEKLIQTIRDVADDNPDYVYEAPEHMKVTASDPLCYYVHTSADGLKAGCLIGKALNTLGVPLEVLKANEGAGAGSLIPRVLDLTGSSEAVYSAISFAVYAQSAQDGAESVTDTRMPWGEAVQAAEFNAGLAVL
jgi:hypothetical protein